MSRKARARAPSSDGRLDPSSKVGPEETVSPDSVFSDPSWNMKKLVTTPGVTGSQQLHLYKIPRFPGGFALAIAEYAYARLHVPLIDEDYEVEWLTVQNEVNSLMPFIKFFDSLGRKNLSEITKNDWAQCLKHMRLGKERKRSPDRIDTLVRAAYRLWRYGERLTNPLPAIPFGMSVEKLLPSGPEKRGANKTPCIPDEIFSPLMASAFCYTQEWAPYIIEAWLAVMASWQDISKKRVSASTKDKALAVAVRRILQDSHSFWRLMQWTTLEELLAEVYNLRNAAMLVILAFSGVRTSELLSILVNCCVEDQLPSGEKVWYLNTVLHKHRAGGKRDTWVVVHEVVEAIKILERLTQFIRAVTKKDGLLLTNGHAPFSVNSDLASFKWTPYTSASIIYQINAFVDHCAVFLGRDIPLHETQSGKLVKWRFNARQFRRTLARHIVRRPFGMIAGMLQYKHVSVATFEGYAGNEPEWNRLVSDEQELFDVDILGEIALDIAAGEIAGGLGKELATEYALEFEGQAMDAGASQIAKWLESGSQTIHVGKLNLCLFRPERALCTGKSPDANKPVLNSCDPGNCSNACVRKEHLPIWQGQLEQTIEFAALSKRNKIQREVLNREAERIRDIITMAKDR
jgi:integrase